MEVNTKSTCGFCYKYFIFVTKKSFMHQSDVGMPSEHQVPFAMRILIMYANKDLIFIYIIIYFIHCEPVLLTPLNCLLAEGQGLT